MREEVVDDLCHGHNVHLRVLRRLAIRSDAYHVVLLSRRRVAPVSESAREVRARSRGSHSV